MAGVGVFSISTCTMCNRFSSNVVFLMVLQNPSKSFQIFNFRIIFKKTKQQKKQLSKNTSSGVKQRQLHNFCSPSNSTPITPSSKTTARTTKPECPIVRKVLPDIFGLRTLVQGASVRVAEETNPGKPRTEKGNGLTCSIRWDSCLYIYIYIYFYLVYMFVQNRFKI